MNLEIYWYPSYLALNGPDPNSPLDANLAGMLEGCRQLEKVVMREEMKVSGEEKLTTEWKDALRRFGERGGEVEWRKMRAWDVGVDM